MIQLRTALLAGMQSSLLKRLGTHEIMHFHPINTKNAKNFMKTTTRIFCEYGANLGSSSVQSERVALFIASERATYAGT